MRVGVDATSWANRRGYGRFARNVVGGSWPAGEDEYVLFTDDRTAREEELPQGAIDSHGDARPPAGVDSPRSLRDLVRAVECRIRRASRRVPLPLRLHVVSRAAEPLPSSASTTSSPSSTPS